MGPDGLEPSTPRLSSACSNQLSYEPPSPFPWWSRSDSNRRPPACKAGALPTKLRPRVTYLLSLLPSAVKLLLSGNLLCAHVRGHRRPYPTSYVSITPGFLHRKEVIQPQVPLGLPCYDLVPITNITLGRRPLSVG